MAIFIILYGNYYPPHGDFKLICIGKFSRRTWVNITQQYGKNRQRCQQNKFYYAVWQLLYYYREFPSKILSMHKSKLCDNTVLNLRCECQSSNFYTFLIGLSCQITVFQDTVYCVLCTVYVYTRVVKKTRFWGKHLLFHFPNLYV